MFIYFWIFILAEKDILKRDDRPTFKPQVPVPGVKYEDPFGKFRFSNCLNQQMFCVKTLFIFPLAAVPPSPGQEAPFGPDIGAGQLEKEPSGGNYDFYYYYFALNKDFPLGKDTCKVKRNLRIVAALRLITLSISVKSWFARHCHAFPAKSRTFKRHCVLLEKLFSLKINSMAF